MIERRFPSTPGSYLLWLYLARSRDIDVGRLGRCRFRRGWYFYSGSAFGPGGLAARLGHHRHAVVRPHWHIDYLRKWAVIRAVWLCRGVNREHEWSASLQTLPGAEMPYKGFGSSDCKCRSHLVYLARQPAAAALRRLLDGDCRLERFRLADNRDGPAGPPR